MCYIRFNVNSPQGQTANFNNHDGTVMIFLDEIKREQDEFIHCNTEESIISRIIDVIIHEDLHKAIDEAGEVTNNEDDERIMRKIRNFIQRESL